MSGDGPGHDDGPDESAPPANVIILPGLQGGKPRVDAWSLDDSPDTSSTDESIEATDDLAPPPAHLLDSAVEALLLASGEPISTTDLNRYLCDPGEDAVTTALEDLADRLRSRKSGVRLLQVAKGWQLRTDVRFAAYVAAMRGGKPVRLSKAALETLSMVAYRQPVTRSEVEDLRGVDSGGVMRMLVERGLLHTVGRHDSPGRPLLYGTTTRFLEMFGLRDLSELPTLRDLRELREDDPGDGPVPVASDDEDHGPITVEELLPTPPRAPQASPSDGAKPPKLVQEPLPFRTGPTDDGTAKE